MGLPERSPNRRVARLIGRFAGEWQPLEGTLAGMFAAFSDYRRLATVALPRLSNRPQPTRAPRRAELSDFSTT